MGPNALVASIVHVPSPTPLKTNAPPAEAATLRSTAGYPRRSRTVAPTTGCPSRITVPSTVFDPTPARLMFAVTDDCPGTSVPVSGGDVTLVAGSKAVTV